MDKALELLQKFAVDARNGKISKDKLGFGAPWRHPPKKDDATLRFEWAKIQLMDFVQSLVKADFGVCSLFFLIFLMSFWKLLLVLMFFLTGFPFSVTLVAVYFFFSPFIYILYYLFFGSSFYSLILISLLVAAQLYG